MTSASVAFVTALAEGVLTDDSILVDAALDGGVRLPVMLADTALLLRDSAGATLALLPDMIAIRNAWEDAEGWLATALVSQHGFGDDALEPALGWCSAVLCDGLIPIPSTADEQTLTLAVAVALVAKMWAALGVAAWRRFVASRAVPDA